MSLQEQSICNKHTGVHLANTKHLYAYWCWCNSCQGFWSLHFTQLIKQGILIVSTSAGILSPSLATVSDWNHPHETYPLKQSICYKWEKNPTHRTIETHSVFINLKETKARMINLALLCKDVSLKWLLQRHGFQPCAQTALEVTHILALSAACRFGAVFSAGTSEHHFSTGRPRQCHLHLVQWLFSDGRLIFSHWLSIPRKAHTAFFLSVFEKGQCGFLISDVFQTLFDIHSFQTVLSGRLK